MQISRILHDTPWQQYHQNGEPMNGISGDREYFKDPSHIMGAVHVWLWRQGVDGVELLLQHRAKDVSFWPDHWDISAAGHIDVGETPIEAAVRETKEELGVTIAPDRLVYLFGLRTPLKPNEIDHVFLYQVDDSLELEYADGEVEETKWIGLNDYQKLIEDPKEAKMVDQGKGYFTMLIDGVRVVAANSVR